MSKFKHEETTITSSKIVKEIKFQNEEGENIIAEKWASYDENSSMLDDGDMGIIRGQELFDALSDEEQDELTDIINDEFNKN